jgi:predicted DNA-binding protein (UPF0251 family)
MSVMGRSKRGSEKIDLFLEEYQAIKLLDYDGMTQEEAAGHMNVSRPTITRVYETARQKVARALTEGKDLVISGGKYHFDESWFCCLSCKTTFRLEKGSDKICPECNSSEVASLNECHSC